MAKKSEINKKDLINLIEITDEEFARITDNLYSQKIDYKSLPNLVLLPTVKEELRKELNIKGNLYITKNRLLHTNPVRKNAHKNQGFTKEEYSSIPETIRNATYVLKETESEYNSFVITALDKNDSCKVNCIIFDEDKNGNLLTTIKKIPLLSLRSRIYKIVGTGVEPAISNALCEPSTTLTTSPNNENNTTKDEFVNNLAVDTTIINQDSSKSNNSENIAPQEIAERAQFVQNKLSEAGIDVVSDKNEFDTIISKEADGKIFKQQPITEYGKNDFYRKIAGEVEARNVQNRMNMTPEARLNTPLSETEDVAQEDQIVMFEENMAASKITSRSQFLEGKTELSDEDIVRILDLPAEKEIRTQIKSYTDKDYLELAKDNTKLSQLTESLKNDAEYLTYRGSYIAKSKLLYESPVTLCNEIPSLLIGEEIGESFYLLPYGYAKDKSENFKKFADMLERDNFIDIKRNYSTKLKHNFKKGHNQGNNIFFFITSDKTDYEKIRQEINKCVYNRKEVQNKTAKYIVYIEQSNRCGSFSFDTTGKLVTEKEYTLKQIRSFDNERPLVARGRMQSIPSGTSLILNNNDENVNDLFHSLLLRGELEMIRVHPELHIYSDKYKEACSTLGKITNETHSKLLKSSNLAFLQSEKQTQFYKDLQKGEEKTMENTNEEIINQETENSIKKEAKAIIFTPENADEFAKMANEGNIPLKADEAKKLIEIFQKAGLTLRYEPLPDALVINGKKEVLNVLNYEENMIINIPEVLKLAGIKVEENSQTSDKRVEFSAEEEKEYQEWEEMLDDDQKAEEIIEKNQRKEPEEQNEDKIQKMALSKGVLESLTEIGNTIKNDSAMILKSPSFGDVTFSTGVFGDLSKKNNGGYGINHIVEGRYVKDGLTQQDIASLLYLIKDAVETTTVEIDDSKSRQNIIKDGIWVTVRKDFDGIKQNWIVTGFAENDEKGQITKEATDAIKAVNAQYGYAPEHLFVSEQVGAVIASLNNVAQNILMSSDEERIKNFKSVYANTEFLSENEKRSEKLTDEYEADHKKENLFSTMHHTKDWTNDFPSVYSHSLYYGDSVNDKNYSENIKTALLVGKAKRGDRDAAIDLVNQSVRPEIIKELHEKYPDAIVCAVDGLEANGHNMIPILYQQFLKDQGFYINETIIQSAKAHHTGADNLDKLLNRVRFSGEVQKGKDYILLDDHISMGSTLRDLRDYIESNGGNVVAVTTLTAPEQDYKISISKENFEKLTVYGEPLNEFLREYGITDNIKGLTDREATEIIGLLSDRGRNPETQEGIRRSACLRCREIQENYLANLSGSLKKEALDKENPTIKNNNEKSQERHSDAKDYLIQTTRLFLSKLKEKNLPFLRGKERGPNIIIRPQAARDAATGKAFTGYTQLMAQALIQALYDQKKLPELEYDLITYDQAKACGTFIKKGSPHITLTNYNRTTNSASKQMYYFKSGCNSPEMIDLHKESIARNRAIKRIRQSLENKEIPSERQTEEKNKITLLHYEEMTYLKALNKDTEQYFDSLTAEEKEMLKTLCSKEPLTQKTVRELAETLRKDRLISAQLSSQKNSGRSFDATECIVPEDFIGKAMAAASLGCSLETTQGTIDRITKDLHQTLSRNIEHYDYGKPFETGEIINGKCRNNIKDMCNKEYEAEELAKKIEQQQMALKKNPINALMELLNRNDLSDRTIGGYER